jgi:hypothetical protein
MKRFVTANLANSPKAYNNTDTIRNITLTFVPILFKLNLDQTGAIRFSATKYSIIKIARIWT